MRTRSVRAAYRDADGDAYRKGGIGMPTGMLIRGRGTAYRDAFRKGEGCPEGCL